MKLEKKKNTDEGATWSQRDSLENRPRPAGLGPRPRHESGDWEPATQQDGGLGPTGHFWTGVLGFGIPACLPGHREEEGAGDPGEQPDFRPGKAGEEGSPV